jgi:hypothetical protein
MNFALRITSIKMVSPDLPSESTSYFGTVTEVTDATSGKDVDAMAIALTIFGIGIPMLTSVGSFFISYLTYNPLRVRKRAAEEMLIVKNDEIRRLEAILIEYEADPDFAEHLREDDEGKYEEMRKMHRAMVINYCEYVRQRLKEHLANPSAISALSEETCMNILDRLDREFAVLNQAEAIEGGEDDVAKSAASKSKTDYVDVSDGTNEILKGEAA